MNWNRWRNLALAAAGAMALGGCVSDGYGYSSVGIGSGGWYNDPYYYGPWGTGGYYGAPAYGWYDGFYYPGSGAWIYDRGGQRHRMRDRDRQHWRSLTPGQQQAIRNHWRQHADGGPGRVRPGREQRQAIRERWQQTSPADRQALRQRWQQASPADRQAARERWQQRREDGAGNRPAFNGRRDRAGSPAIRSGAERPHVDGRRSGTNGRPNGPHRR